MGILSGLLFDIMALHENNKSLQINHWDKEELYKREPLVLISLIDLKDKKPGDIIVQKRFRENLLFSFYSHCILYCFK